MAPVKKTTSNDDLTLSVGLLNQRMAVVESQVPALMERINKLLDKLQETVTEMSERAIRQSGKIENIETTVNDIKKNQDDMSNRLETLAKESAKVDSDVSNRLENLEKQESEMGKRLRSLEKWRWMLSGILLLLSLIVPVLVEFGLKAFLLKH